MNEVSMLIATKPIPISIKNNQYSLSIKQIDPIQNSPPSLWKMRLQKRIGDNPLKKTNIICK